MSRLFYRRKRDAELRKRYADLLAQQRFFYYAKAAGMFLPDYEENAFFSDEQMAFFAEYEIEMADCDDER